MRQRGTPGISTRVATAAFAILAARAAWGAAPSLAPGVTPAALEQARQAAAAPGLTFTAVRVFAAQSFRLTGADEEVSLVSGEGTLPAKTADANPVQGCFAALVRPDGASVVPTIGAGEWEAETCNGVAAVGLLPAQGDTSRAVFIYKTSAPHASPKEPVVVSWTAGGGLSIDAEASKRASQAGADSIGAVRGALK